MVTATLSHLFLFCYVGFTFTVKTFSSVKFLAHKNLQGYENAVHSFIESNNPEGMIENSVDMSDVINSEQQSLAREAETAISEWIFERADHPAGSP